MALKKTMQFSGTTSQAGEGWSQASVPCNVTIQDVYIKVENTVSGKTLCQATVSLTASDFVSSRSYTFVPDVTDSAKNIIKQTYEYLKSLPEFSGAVNVLESGQTP